MCDGHNKLICWLPVTSAAMRPSALITFTCTMPTSFRLQNDFNKPCSGAQNRESENRRPIKLPLFFVCFGIIWLCDQLSNHPTVYKVTIPVFGIYSSSTFACFYPTCGACAHVVFKHLLALLRVIQRRDGQVSDGDVSRGSQRDQHHHEAPGLLQWQLQVMCLLLC